MEQEQRRPKLAAIIPAFNEGERIKPTLRDAHAFAEKQPYDVSVIVVNNNSTDNTEDVVREHMKSMPELQIISGEKDCAGKGCTVKHGMLHAEADYILFMDADNATPLNEVDLFWPAVDEGFDIVIGSRHVKGSEITADQPWYRKLLGRSANLLIQVMLLPGIKDTQAGFKLFSHEAAKRIFPLQTIDRWGFDMEILALAKTMKYKIKEVPISWHDVGESRLRPVQAAIGTLTELLMIRWRLISGYYKKLAREQGGK